MASQRPLRVEVDNLKGVHMPLQATVRRPLVGIIAILGVFALVFSMLVGSPAAMAAPSQLKNVTQPSNTEDWYPDRPNSTVIAAPGTDDSSFLARNRGIFGNREAYRLLYPESAGPFIGGRAGFFLTAPSYSESVDIGVVNLVESLRQINEQSPEGERKSIILTGYSQGSRVVYLGAKEAIEKGYLNEDDLIVFVSSPGGPWGLATQADRSPFVSALAQLVGFQTGVDDPNALGDMPSEQHVIVGDSVGGQVFNPLRPVSSLAMLAVGHLIHSSLTTQSYNNLDELGTPTIYKSTTGNMTVYVYEDVHHPMTLAAELVVSRLSFGLAAMSEAQKDRLDRFVGRVFPLTPLTEQNAGIGLVKVQQGDLPDYRQPVANPVIVPETVTENPVQRSSVPIETPLASSDEVDDEPAVSDWTETSEPESTVNPTPQPEPSGLDETDQSVDAREDDVSDETESPASEPEIESSSDADFGSDNSDSSDTSSSEGTDSSDTGSDSETTS